MSATATLPMEPAALVEAADSLRTLLRQAIAHALWDLETHRVGAPVHGNDWHHWFEAKRFVEQVLAERVERRAYFLWKEECDREKRAIHGEPGRFWRLAEKLERGALLLRVAEVAYYRWLNECKMMGCIVHGNDWYHWFAAEQKTAVALAGEVNPICFSYDEQQEVVPEKNRVKRGGRTNVGVDNCPALDGGTESRYDPNGHADGFSREGIIVVDRKTPNQAVPEVNCQLSIVESRELDSSDFPDRVYWTVDLADPKFLNKVIATDSQVTEVLAVADSLEQLSEIMASPEFRRMLLERHADECLIHSGPVG